jgi:hypothetical protein
MCLRRPFSVLALVLGVLILPHAWIGAVVVGQTPHWSSARWDSAGLAPDPASHPDPVVQVYAARTWGWRGIFAVHTWIVMKREGAAAYERYDVVRWGLASDGSSVRRDFRGRAPDGYWAGNRPSVLVDHRGPEVNAMIQALDAAIAGYPYAHSYRTWPGPNSNTFVAHLARAVPALGLDLPPTAVGKDFLTNGGVLASTPSGTGYQLSLLGLIGVSIARSEGFELNLLGLTLGLDPLGLAIKLPGIGRLGLP